VIEGSGCTDILMHDVLGVLIYVLTLTFSYLVVVTS
jgi:hypothetical protein